MNVLVSGATGFLGSFVTRAALEAGHSVIGLTRRASELSRLAGTPSGARLQLVAVDSSPDAVERVFDSHRIDAVIHTATSYGRGAITAATYPELIEANLNFPMRILHAAVNQGTPLFINTDSYFNKPRQTYNSLQGYSLSKKYFLDWLQHHCDRIHVVNMRLEHLYGPTDGQDKFIPTVVEQIARQKVASFDMTPGEQSRDFVYVTDAAAAFMLVLHDLPQARSGHDYFEIGTGMTSTIRDIAMLIKKVSNSPTELRFGALAYRPDEIEASVADPAFHDRFGFDAAVTIERGVQNLVGYEE